MDWQPIKTMPQDGTLIIIAGKMEERHGGYWLFDTVRCYHGMYWSATFGENTAKIMRPTHWAHFNYPGNTPAPKR